jgi:polyisoprenyl-phosphate glycosyltransferase
MNDLDLESGVRAPLISVIIPVFNEESNVKRAFEAVTAEFKKLNGSYRLELLFSDNGSGDNTVGEIEKLTSKHDFVKAILLARNFGFQRSVLTALHHCTGDAAVQLDCDLQDPPELIPKFLEHWEAGYDVVVGIRRKRKENMLLNFGRKMFYKLVTKMSDDNIMENAGDFRLVDRTVIERVKSTRDTRPYTRGLISALSAKQIGIVYDREERMFEESKFPIRKLAGFAADGIISHSLVPLRIAGVFGLVVFIITFIVAIYYLMGSLFVSQNWPAGFTTLVLLLLVSIGLNAIFAGIVGEYVGRIYDQVRPRPITIIERTLNFSTEVDGKRNLNTELNETDKFDA